MLVFSLFFPFFNLISAETEIQLIEIVGFDFMGGDNPLDTPEQSGSTQIGPTQFHATINSTYLSVSSEAQTTSTLIVRRAADNAIVSQQQFSTDAASFLPEGEYTLEINCLGLTLVGAFCANN